MSEPSPRSNRSMRLALVLLVAAAGWGGWLAARAGLQIGSIYSDGQRMFVERPAVRSAIWLEPTPVDLPGNETPHRPTVSPDGQLLVFAVGERGLGAKLHASERTATGWSAPRPLFELNSSGDDLAPSFGPHGLLFASDRGPLGRGLDLWYARFDEYGFAEPELLAPGMQSDADDTDPVQLDGRRIVFASNRDGDYDLFEADLAATPVEARALRRLNTKSNEREPTARGANLWFVSDRDESGYQLFQSFRARGEWLAPDLVAEFEGTERAPWIAPDGFTLWMERGDEREIAIAQSAELHRVPAPEAGWREWFLLAALLVLAACAWMSRRSAGLEVITRCLLVSLIAHLALLWFLRDVHPETQEMVGVPEETRYAVTLLPSGDAPAGGRAAPASGPSRRSAEIARPSVVATTVAARPSRPVRGETRSRPDEPDRATRQEMLTVELPSVAAPELVAETKRRLDPRVTGIVRTADAGDARRAARSTGSTATATSSSTVATRAPSSAVGALSSAPSPTLAPSTPMERVAVDLPSVAAGATSDAPAPGVAQSAVLLGARRQPAGGGPARRSKERSVVPSVAVAAPAAQARASAPGALLMNEEVSAVRPSRSGSTANTALSGLVASALPPNREASPGTAGGGAPRAVRFDRQRARAESGPRRHRREERAALVAAGDVDLQRRATERDDAAISAPIAPAYGNRFGDEKERALIEFGGNAATERSVAEGLAYLASIQRADGGWGKPARHEKYQDVRIGKSGLALLAFLGAGNLPGRPGEHRETVERAVRYLLGEQLAGGHFGDCNAYGHGIASYALAEALAMTHDEFLREPLERAIRHMLENQTRSGDQRMAGGWTYYSQNSRGHAGDRWSRTSVTAWQVMALVSARSSGLEVPSEALEGAREFLLAAWDNHLGAFRYAHSRERLDSDYPTLPASTPGAMFALSLLGEDISDERFSGARRFLAERRPRRFRAHDEVDAVFQGDSNLYYWAYATLALFRVGGDEWRRWNVALQEQLLPAQAEDGSWPSVSIYHAYADDDDRAYSTSLGVMMMEIYYRYTTPTVTAQSVFR